MSFQPAPSMLPTAGEGHTVIPSSAIEKPGGGEGGTDTSGSGPVVVTGVVVNNQHPHPIPQPLLYPYTTMCVKPRYIPMQIPGDRPLHLPPYDPNRPYSMWSTSLCSIIGGHPSVCCDVALCMQCTVVRHTYLISKGYSDPCVGWYFLFLLIDLLSVGFVTIGLAAETRIRVAQFFHINMSNHATECMTGYFCFPCSICQVQRELLSRGVEAHGTCCKSSPAPVHQAAGPIRMQ